MDDGNPFEAVLDRLREKGWCKGKLGGEDGPNCLLGAANQEGIGVQFSLGDIIRNEYPDRVNYISSAPTVSFNNHPDTTFQDVEKILEKAAVKWEEEAVTL